MQHRWMPYTNCSSCSLLPSFCINCGSLYRWLISISRWSLISSAYSAALQIAAQEVLEQFTHGRYADGYTHLLAGAVYGAFVPILDGRLNVMLPGEAQDEHSDAISFDQYLNSMFTYLRKGF